MVRGSGRFAFYARAHRVSGEQWSGVWVGSPSGEQCCVRLKPDLRPGNLRANTPPEIKPLQYRRERTGYGTVALANNAELYGACQSARQAGTTACVRGGKH